MIDLSNAHFAFLDLETTGLSPWFGDRVCEVGIVLSDGKRIKETYQTLVNPGRPLSPAAASTNRLDNETLRNAPIFSEIAGEIAKRLQGAIVVCHNAPFDLQFLDSEFRRLDRELHVPQVIDTLKIARENFDLPSYCLSVVAESFWVQVGEFHRALEDALTARLVFFSMMDLLKKDNKPLNNFISAYLSPAVPDDEIQLPTGLGEAIHSGKRLLITYVDGKGDQTQRWITPIQVLGMEDYIYLRAYCHLRKEERTFRLDRLVEVRIETDPNPHAR
ncbi:MAG: WYL domain-containing protein [Anaerolineales bacterium]|nr:WYL domain-containing protein [Anaerolineales bacterium]